MSMMSMSLTISGLNGFLQKSKLQYQVLIVLSLQILWKSDYREARCAFSKWCRAFLTVILYYVSILWNAVSWIYQCTMYCAYIFQLEVWLYSHHLLKKRMRSVNDSKVLCEEHKNLWECFFFNSLFVHVLSFNKNVCSVFLKKKKKSCFFLQPVVNSTYMVAIRSQCDFKITIVVSWLVSISLEKKILYAKFKKIIIK